MAVPAWPLVPVPGATLPSAIVVLRDPGDAGVVDGTSISPATEAVFDAVIALVALAALGVVGGEGVVGSRQDGPLGVVDRTAMGIAAVFGSFAAAAQFR